MKRESNYDNDGLDPSESISERRKINDQETYFPPEESELPLLKNNEKRNDWEKRITRK